MVFPGCGRAFRAAANERERAERGALVQRRAAGAAAWAAGAAAVRACAAAAAGSAGAPPPPPPPPSPPVALLRGWLGLSARLPWHPRQRAHPQHLQPVPLRSAAALDGARSLRAASPPGSLCPLPGRGKSAAASCEAEQGSAPDTVPMHGQRGRPAALRRQALAGATLPGAGCLCMCGQGTRAGARAQVGAAGAPLAHLHMLQHIGLIDVRALPRQHACAGMRGGQHTRAHLSSGVLERGGARGGGGGGGGVWRGGGGGGGFLCRCGGARRGSVRRVSGQQPSVKATCGGSR